MVIFSLIYRVCNILINDTLKIKKCGHGEIGGKSDMQVIVFDARLF